MQDDTPIHSLTPIFPSLPLPLPLQLRNFVVGTTVYLNRPPVRAGCCVEFQERSLLLCVRLSRFRSHLVFPRSLPPEDKRQQRRYFKLFKSFAYQSCYFPSVTDTPFCYTHSHGLQAGRQLQAECRYEKPLRRGFSLCSSSRGDPSDNLLQPRE